MSTYMGLRQTSNLDEPEQFLLDLEKTWALLLPGFVRPDRIDYFRQFIRRRTALAIGSTVRTSGFRVISDAGHRPVIDGDPTDAC